MPHSFTKLERQPPASGLPIQKPNLVIFMPDQLRWDALGCNGNPIAKTPNIDRFSQRAPRGDTYAPTVTELSMNEYGFLVTPDILPGFMAGSKGANDSANQTKNRDELAPRLFYKGLRDQSAILDYDEAAVRSAENFLDHPPEGPWVLFLPLIFPHVPFQVEEPYFSLYDRKSMPAPAQLSEKSGYVYMEEIRRNYKLDEVPSETWAEIQATYFGMISRLDDQFGRIVHKIDNLGLWDSTVTMFFTDHGEYLGDYGLVEKWPTGMSDSLTREPLIIAGAGLPQGQTFDDMAEMADLVPTVFQLCSIPETFPTNGKSWLPCILHGKPHKEYAFVEAGYLASEEPLIETSPFPYDIKAELQHKDHVLAGKAVAVRNKLWTYIYRLYEPAELYSRQNDPQELHNLAAMPEHQPTVRMLECVMFRWILETSDFLPYAVDPRTSEVNLEDPRSQWERRVKATGIY
ncbi:hypothetical protein ZTR_07617 [Talaromyces verruculosus]|nr:hypothetical protein ZTR_07617 [Talaromyces verruculosus]